MLVLFILRMRFGDKTSIFNSERKKRKVKYSRESCHIWIIGFKFLKTRTLKKDRAGGKKRVKIGTTVLACCSG